MELTIPMLIQWIAVLGILYCLFNIPCRCNTAGYHTNCSVRRERERERERRRRRQIKIFLKKKRLAKEEEEEEESVKGCGKE
jgi:hypothetical protein